MSRSSVVCLAGALFVSACGVETPEQAAAWEAHDDALERSATTAAVAACANTESSYTASLGDNVCEGVPGSYGHTEDDGTCPAGETPVTATSNILCDVATGLLSEPGDCPSGCNDMGVSEPSSAASASSCTVSKYRNCEGGFSVKERAVFKLDN